MNNAGHFLKISGFPYKPLLAEVQACKDELNWQENQASGMEYQNLEDGRYHNGRQGTRWCHFAPSEPLIQSLERLIGHPIYRKTFYLWDYLDKKLLPVHLDTPEINSGRAIACSVPILGQFRLRFHSDSAGRDVLSECDYSPGDVVLLNNLRFHHSGEVLSQTRLGLHCFLDYPADELPSIEAILWKQTQPIPR